MKKTSKNTVSGSGWGSRWVPSFNGGLSKTAPSKLKGKLLEILNSAGMDAMLLALITPILQSVPESVIQTKFQQVIKVLDGALALSDEEIRAALEKFRAELISMNGDGDGLE
jgi:hypothetical protein